MSKLIQATVEILAGHEGRDVRWGRFCNFVQKRTGFTPIQILAQLNTEEAARELRSLGYCLEVRRRTDAEWSTRHGQVVWSRGTFRVKFGPPPKFLSSVMLRGLTVRILRP